MRGRGGQYPRVVYGATVGSRLCRGPGFRLEIEVSSCVSWDSQAQLRHGNWISECQGHLSLCGCEAVSRTSWGQRGEPASVPASCQTAVSRPLRWDFTSSLPALQRAVRAAAAPACSRAHTCPVTISPGMVSRPVIPQWAARLCPAGCVSSEHLPLQSLSGSSEGPGVDTWERAAPWNILSRKDAALSHS